MTSSISFMLFRWHKTIGRHSGARRKARARNDPDGGCSWLARLPSLALAPLARQPLPHRDEIIGRKELGRKRTPGAAFDLHVDDIVQMRREPQGDDLSDPHHHVPADDLDALRRKPFPPAGRGEMSLDSLQIFRLIVLEE